jgi:hypothetical protein
MKVWLGVIGRACIEFLIILALLSFAAGAAATVAAPSSVISQFLLSSAEAALELVPLAAVLTLFLAFFSFELRVRSRFASWIGLFFLGAILLAFGIGIRRVPLLQELVAGSAAEAGQGSARLIPAETVLQRGRVALWLGSIEGGEASDAVAVDFGSDYPRLAYAPRSQINPSTGDVEILGRTYKAARPASSSMELVPEASFFSGSWIWDRLAAMDGEPILLAIATAAGFLLLAVGFRFLCRITGWPLANALLAAAGLAGLVVLDAALSGVAVLGTIESLSGRIGVSLRGPLLIAGIEGLLGLVLGLTDLAAAPKSRRRIDG